MVCMLSVVCFIGAMVNDVWREEHLNQMTYLAWTNDRKGEKWYTHLPVVLYLFFSNNYNNYNNDKLYSRLSPPFLSFYAFLLLHAFYYALIIV